MERLLRTCQLRPALGARAGRPHPGGPGKRPQGAAASFAVTHEHSPSGRHLDPNWHVYQFQKNLF